MKLGLIFTLNVSVEIWNKQGLLDREKLIYEEFIKRHKFKKIYWFTYGVSDKQYERYIYQGIEIIEMPKIFNFRLGKIIYSFVMPVIQSKYLKECDVVKTNQIKGSWTAWIATVLYRRKFLLRAGYLWSVVGRQKYGAFYLTIISIIERLMYKLAHAVIVVSNSQKEYIIKNYGLKKSKVFIVSNYVNTEIFRPSKDTTKLKDRLVFVGRIHKEKNLTSLIFAIKNLSLGLDVYGNGDLKSELEELVRKNSVDVIFMGFISNAQLPQILQKYSYFILPSLYEGMPKALLEAMACGLVVMGTNVDGIREIIRHGENGWLIENPSAEKIRETLSLLGSDREVENKMVIQARKFIEENFSLTHIIEQELSVLGKICLNHIMIE